MFLHFVLRTDWFSYEYDEKDHWPCFINKNNNKIKSLWVWVLFIFYFLVREGKLGEKRRGIELGCRASFQGLIPTYPVLFNHLSSNDGQTHFSDPNKNDGKRAKLEQ